MFAAIAFLRPECTPFVDGFLRLNDPGKEQEMFENWRSRNPSAGWLSQKRLRL